MKKAYTLFFLCYLGLAFGAYSQLYYNQVPGYLKANSIWIFGEYGGLDLSTPVPTPFVSPIRSYEQSVTVSDSATGQLQFFAGGHGFQSASAPDDTGRCWNRNMQAMPNGDGLKGCGFSGSTAQGFAAVPVIDSPGKYYLFSLRAQGGKPALYYSVVDMSMDGGLGDLSRKNILLDSGALSEAMIAIPGNNCDVWLVVHAFREPVFKAFRISAEGISDPVISEAGERITRLVADYPEYNMCNMAVSPDRSMLALTVNYTTIADGGHALRPGTKHTSGTHLFHFDSFTGTVSDAVRVHSYGVCYGVAFSPDNSKLYTVVKDFGAPRPPAVIRQYDVQVYDSAQIASSAYDYSPAVNSQIVDLRLYDGRIYVSSVPGVMNRINQPNQQGAAANYQTGAIALLIGQNSASCLSSPVVYPFYDTFYHLSMDTLICRSLDGLVFSGPEGYAGYTWSDGVTGVSRTFPGAGTYVLHSAGPCHSRKDTFIIRGNDVVFDLGPDTVLCNADPLLLQPGIAGAAYRWQDGSTDSVYLVAAPGTYRAEVTLGACTYTDTVTIHYADLRQSLGSDQFFCQRDEIYLELQARVPAGYEVRWQDGSSGTSYLVQDSGTYWVAVQDSVCTGSDTVRIEKEYCGCFLELPTAFTPNGDGRNDSWRPVIEPGCPVRKYQVRLFNRWGVQVFSSARVTDAWDGTWNGAPATSDVYMYELRFQGGTGAEVYKKGDVTLIR